MKTSKKEKMHDIRIPFTGFYESIHSMPLDDEIEQVLEENPEKTYDDLIIDNSGYEQEYSIDYLQAMIELLNDEYSINIKLGFDSIDSPKEYNFDTDTITAKISESDIILLINYHIDNSYNDLKALIKEECTSRDGFISFYSNDLKEWDITKVMEWDELQLGFLIEAVISDDIRELQPQYCYEIANNYVSIKE